MVLLPLVCSKVNVPVIAAGGVCDGVSMAAAFALGAEGVQMGTRMVSAAESPVHDNWKRAIVAAAETDTVFLNRFSRPGLRALRTQKEIYVATRRADGSRSKAAPIWFWSDGRVLYFSTSPASHKAKRIRKGSPVFFSLQARTGRSSKGRPRSSPTSSWWPGLGTSTRRST
jgi:hypothetical protein